VLLQVSGSVIFPGAGYFMAAAAATSMLLPAGTAATAAAQLALSNLTIPAPLILPNLAALSQGRSGQQLPMLEVRVSTAAGSLQICSHNPNTGAQTVHVQSGVAVVQANSASSSSSSSSRVGALAARAATFLGGLMEVPAASAVKAAAGATASLAAADHNDGCDLDVGLLDSWLQLGQVFILDRMAAGGVYVPTGLELMLLPMTPASRKDMLAYVQPCEDATAPAAVSRQAVSDYSLAAAAGSAATVCSITRMTAKPITQAAAVTAAAAGTTAERTAVEEPELMYSVQWQAVDSEGATATAAADAFALQLQSMTAAAPAAGAATALAALQGMLLHGQQRALQLNGWDGPSLAGVGAVMSPAPDAIRGQLGTIAAMLRTVALEQQELQLTVSSSSSSDAAASSTTLSAGKSAGADVFGQLSSAGAAYQPRLLPAAALNVPHSFQLLPEARGSLDALTRVPVSSWQLAAGDGEVLVKVAAVGINFRDVLNVLGMYPGDPGAPGAWCRG
jgi:hypothetical protein